MTIFLFRMTFCVLFFAASSALPIHCGTINPKALALWLSPDGLSSATVTPQEGSPNYQLRVGAIKDDSSPIPNIYPVTKNGPPDLTPSFKGFWDKQNRFCFFMIGKQDDEFLSVCGVRFTLQPPAVVSGQSVAEWKSSSPLWPNTMSDDIVDTMKRLHKSHQPSIISHGNSGATSVRWIEPDQIEVRWLNRFMFSEGEGLEWNSYTAVRIMTYQLTSDGFFCIKEGSLALTQIDPKTKAETPIKLPEPTPTDELRAAVRSNDRGRVESLLAKGIAPDDNSETASPLVLAIKNSNLDLVTVLLQAHAKVGWREVATAHTQPDPKIWQVVFKAPLSLEDEDIFWICDRLFRGPRNMKKATVEEWQSRFDFTFATLARGKANLNARDSKTGDTILIKAAKNRIPATQLPKLISMGMDPSLKNNAGETASDISAKLRDISNLHLLDFDHRYASLLKEYTIPADSPFIGSWGDNYIATIHLKPDSSGTYSSMFGGMVSWKQTSDTIDVQIIVERSPEDLVIMNATGRLSEDKKALLLKFVGEAAKTLGTEEQKYEKRKQGE